MQSNSDIFLEEMEQSQEDNYGYAYQSEMNERFNTPEQEMEDFEDIPGAPTALTFFDKGLTKSDIKIMASKAIENLLEEGNPLKVAESLSAMELFIKELKADKRYTDYVREEAAKTPKGYVSASGAKIELAETGSSYDYSNCGDPKYLDYLRDVEDANTQLKLHQEFLRTIPAKGITVTDQETGETITIYPPAKSSNSSYKVTLSK